MNTQPTDEESVSRIEVTRQMLESAARREGYWLSADCRIGESDAAHLLGFAVGSLARKRAEGAGPVWYRLGGAGHKVSYRLHDLAAFIETMRDQSPEPVATRHNAT